MGEWSNKKNIIKNEYIVTDSIGVALIVDDIIACYSVQVIQF